MARHRMVSLLARPTPQPAATHRRDFPALRMTTAFAHNALAIDAEVPTGSDARPRSFGTAADPLMSGADYWHGAAVLVVDVQQDFLTERLGPMRRGYEDRIAELLNVARVRGIEVVHVHSQFAADGSDWMPRYRARGRIPCVRGTAGAHVVEAAAPDDGEPVVTKQTFDAFLNTDLSSLLEGRGVRRVLVAGLVTGTCVLLTAASAMQRGFDVAVVEDAVADDPQTHADVLRRYGYIFDLVRTDQVSAWARAV